MKKKLIIVGLNSFAEIAYEYFTNDSDYQVEAFAVEKEFLTLDKKFNIPVVDVDLIESIYKPDEYYFFVAITYINLNRTRTRLFNRMKNIGYTPASYISSNCFLWKNVVLGDHIFIFENNTIQPFAQIKDNVILWSGNHIGHHSIIFDNVFVSSHVVISGFCKIKNNSFLGVNSTISNNITIEEDNWIGPGVIINQSTEKNLFYSKKKSIPLNVTPKKFFKINN